MLSLFVQSPFAVCFFFTREKENRFVKKILNKSKGQIKMK